MKRYLLMGLVSVLFIVFCGAPPEEAKTEVKQSETKGADVAYQTLTESELQRFLKAFPVVKAEMEELGEEFEGVITGVARFGMFVQLVENMVEGLVRVELLGNEWFVFDEGRQRLTGSSSGTEYRLGQRVDVRVDRVDRVLQRVDFSLAGTVVDHADLHLTLDEGG